MKTLSRFAVPGSFTPESTPLLVHIDRQAVEFAARRLPAFVESRQPAQCGVQPLLVRLCVGFTEPSCKIILPFLCLVPKLTDESGVHSVGLEYRDPCEPRGWPADIERLPGPCEPVARPRRTRSPDRARVRGKTATQEDVAGWGLTPRGRTVCVQRSVVVCHHRADQHQPITLQWGQDRTPAPSNPVAAANFCGLIRKSPE